MAEWRFLGIWTREELRLKVEEFSKRPPNFDLPLEKMTEENGWDNEIYSAPIGFESPGPPLEDGLFRRAQDGMRRYIFSDPAIAEAYFDPCAPLEGRTMALVFKAFGLRYLNGVRVRNVDETRQDDRTTFSYCYVTLQGHIEKGWQEFLLQKDHGSGEVRFRIQSKWQPGEFPNWWSRIGFHLIGPYFRQRWKCHAPERLRKHAAELTGKGGG
ncbi:MAG: DUF1990 domain-containing protein [Armatimonadetes bacterium]|nr:DUF1990 domain-containing protein [Armatimonadota bacterium]